MSAIPPEPDPKSSPAYRAAKLAVIILSTLIVLALGALIAGVVMKRGGPAAATAGAPVSFALPPGARIVSQTSEPGRLILRVRSGAGEEIDIIDTGTGRLVGRVATGAAK